MRVEFNGYRSDKKDVLKIHNHDTYSCDIVLAKIAVKLLKKFKKCRLKVPGVPTLAIEDHYKATHGVDHVDDDYVCEVSDEAEAYYIDQVNEIIWALEQIVDDKERGKFYKRNGKKWKTEEVILANGEPGYRLVESGYELDVDGLKEYEDRINKGLMLFGKYFRTLWW